MRWLSQLLLPPVLVRTCNEEPDYIELPPDRTQVFPPRMAGRPALTRVHLPNNIDTIYRETHWALCSGSVILAGIGMRAVLEAVCAKKRARGKDLEKRIDNLVELGVLSTNDAKVLHRLRDFGNEAAHRFEALDSRRRSRLRDGRGGTTPEAALLPLTTRASESTFHAEAKEEA